MTQKGLFRHRWWYGYYLFRLYGSHIGICSGRPPVLTGGFSGIPQTSRKFSSRSFQLASFQIPRLYTIRDFLQLNSTIYNRSNWSSGIKKRVNQLRYSLTSKINIVACRPVAKRWLYKQRPLLDNARNIHEGNNKTTVLCNPFLDNGSINSPTPIVIDGGGVFCSVRQSSYKEDNCGDPVTWELKVSQWRED
jgi:hypothetical protein